MASHAVDEIIARGNAVTLHPEEDGDTGEPIVLELYLDEDEQYRWYHEDGTASDAAGPTLHNSFAAARVVWPNFELIEHRGEMVEPGTEREIRDVYATDELDARSKVAPD